MANLLPKCAAAFFAVWLSMLFFSETFEGAFVFVRLAVVLAVGVLVPLGLQLFHPTKLRAAYPFAAAAAIGSLLLPAGPIAGSLAGLWLLFSGAFALFALHQLWQAGRTDRSGWTVVNLSKTAAFGYLPVGAMWLVLNRLGINPLGFVDLVVLLTALHFHYAGFCAPLLIGLAGAQIKKPSALYKVSALSVIAGSPLLALGFTMSPPIEALGASMIAVGIAMVALLTLLQLVPSKAGPTKYLLMVSSLCGMVGMALAVYYAMGELFQVFTISIPQMAHFHGAANALGFALCGLLAWKLDPSKDA